MTQGKRKTWVIGHKNPDTDSICPALFGIKVPSSV